MLQTFRERLAVLLIVLLPFHAFMVTVGTRLLEGPKHAPLSSLAIWKEVVLLLIFVIAVCEILFTQRPEEAKRPMLLPVDKLDLIVLALLLLGVLTSFFGHGDMTKFVYGFKYDFVPLLAFVLLRRVPWSEEIIGLLHRLLVTIGAVVAVFGVISLIVPESLFILLGYSDLHSLYLADAPIAAFQKIGGTAIRRVQSTMSGPNQLGIWLLIPLSLAMLNAFRCRLSNIMKKVLTKLKVKEEQHRCIPGGYAILISFGIALTFSRSAWIAAAVIIFVAFADHLSKEKFRRFVVRTVVSVIFFLALVSVLYPQIIVRAASTRDHWIRPREAVMTMIQNPLGLGLGTVGPASNRISDPCVHLPSGSDYSWTANHPNLCVFVGDERVSPQASCTCPSLPENWYLQIGIEMGILGFILYIVFIVLVLMKLFKSNDSFTTRAVFMAVLGVSIASLFLHAWEDAAVAYTLWMLVAAVLPVQWQEEKEGIKEKLEESVSKLASS